jgi:hypothetical protein
LKGITSALAAAGALALVSAAGATDDGLWLFPASHGSDTIAAWRAQEGEADDQGSANQAVLLEKDAFAGDNSAAAHVIGLEGQPVRVVALAYEYRAKDGVCTVTDPRWALFVQGRTGRQYEVNLGCKVAPASPGAQPGWIRRTFSRGFVSAEVFRKGGPDALGGQVTGLALVFDRTVGHVFVDNIRAQARIANTWTYAGDNGGTTPPGGSTPSFTAEQTALLAAPLSGDEQLTQDELFASLTADEWAQVNAEEPTG